MSYSYGPPRELDSVELLVTVTGHTAESDDELLFKAGTRGTVVETDGDSFYVEVVRTTGPDYPADGFVGGTEGFFTATAAQLRVTWRAGNSGLTDEQQARIDSAERSDETKPLPFL